VYWLHLSQETTEIGWSLRAIALLQSPAPHLAHLHLEPLLSLGQPPLLFSQPPLLFSQLSHRLGELIHAVGKLGYRLGQFPYQARQGQKLLGQEERSQLLPPVGVFPEQPYQIVEVLKLKKHAQSSSV